MSLNRHIQARFGLASDIGHATEENRTVTNILSRCSHRAFSEQAIPEDLLNTLFATAFSAPSKSDLQQACVIHVKDRTKQRRIAEATPSIRWAADAPVFLVWCGDSRRIRRLAEWRGHAFANDHLDAFMNAAVDAGICMQTFIIAAESYGLGCCPVSEIRNHIQLLSGELELPQHVFPVAGLCVGWPQDTPGISLRLPLTTTVHRDRYDDANLFDAVADYDLRREKVDRTPAAQQRLVEDLGVAENYGWSENRTRQYSRPARADFGGYIRRQGFDLS
ncbi:MAG: nitroreductase family protein [Gammaproteobacteria bacterium]|jgi:nitroreductase/FMN reductase [NAD(P)H]|nr:nitroreductase family protein [Gammaproteobacteria bacterium]